MEEYFKAEIYQAGDSSVGIWDFHHVLDLGYNREDILDPDEPEEREALRKKVLELYKMICDPGNPIQVTFSDECACCGARNGAEHASWCDVDLETLPASEIA